MRRERALKVVLVVRVGDLYRSYRLPSLSLTNLA